MTDFTLFLKRLTTDSQAHGRFLNTLSLLEYIGARKIIKSQDECQISMALLTHASDELRHARVFKKLAQEVAGREFRGYGPDELFRGDDARAYFQQVDREVHLALGNPRDCYRITTLLVEERVMRIYPVYEEILGTLGYGGRVAGILKEEEKHLREMAAESEAAPLREDALMDTLRGKEHDAF